MIQIAKKIETTLRLCIYLFARVPHLFDPFWWRQCCIRKPDSTKNLLRFIKAYFQKIQEYTLFIRKSSIRKQYQNGQNLKKALLLAQKVEKVLKDFYVESNNFHLFDKPTRDMTEIEIVKIILV